MNIVLSKKRKILNVSPILITVLLAIIFRTPYTLFLIVMSLVYCIKNFPSSYKIEVNTLIIKKINIEKHISIDSIKHVRKVQSSKKEQEDDKLTTYLISNGENYEVLNRYAKNEEGKTIIDVLLNDYQIPIKYEKAMLFIKTKIEEN